MVTCPVQTTRSLILTSRYIQHPSMLLNAPLNGCFIVFVLFSFPLVVYMVYKRRGGSRHHAELQELQPGDSGRVRVWLRGGARQCRHRSRQSPGKVRSTTALIFYSVHIRFNTHLLWLQLQISWSISLNSFSVSYITTVFWRIFYFLCLLSQVLWHNLPTRPDLFWPPPDCGVCGWWGSGWQRLQRNIPGRVCAGPWVLALSNQRVANNFIISFASDPPLTLLCVSFL